jgi:heterotetrameric sarcosine oxidase gamma subunit
VSAPEPFHCRRQPAAILQFAARERHDVPLPPFGRAIETDGEILLSVHPGRWLALSTRPDDVATPAWAEEFTTRVDLGSAFAVFEIAGPAVREVRARGCRLDLEPDQFPPGHAAATVIAQVSVILVALPSVMLLITPSSTARHMFEWLEHTATVFQVGATP